MITGLAGGKPCFTGVSSPDYFLRAGEWVHFAAVWGIQDGKEGSAGNFALFIDGHKQPRIPTWLSTLDGKVLFTAGAVTPSVSLGCHNGSIDEFRISNVARYDKDFEPPHKAFIPDMHTAVLFHFDGDSVGMSGDTLKKVEAK